MDISRAEFVLTVEPRANVSAVNASDWQRHDVDLWLPVNHFVDDGRD